MKNKLSLAVLLAGIPIFLFIFARPLSNLYLLWLWFAKLGYLAAFKRILSSQVALGALELVFFFLFVFFNLKIAKRNSQTSKPSAQDNVLKVKDGHLIYQNFHRIFPWVLLFISFLVAIEASRFWPQVLAFFNQVPFGKTDPIFDKDISFYVFTLPITNALVMGLLRTITLTIILVVGSYIISEDIQYSVSQKLWISKNAKKHALALCFLAFIFKAFLFLIQRYQLMYQKQTILYGINYTAHKVLLPSFFALFLISLIVALACLYSAIKDSKYTWQIPAGGLALIIVFSIVAQKGVAQIIQKLRVNPNEITLEKPYISNNIKMTNEAFGIDKVKQERIVTSNDLSKRDLQKNSATIENIRLWDEQPILESFSQLQSIRTYYSIASVNNDRYVIDGKYRQLMISARELDSARLPSKIWINERLVYTHGYGLVMSRVNETTKEGLPNLIVKNIPPSSPKELELDTPQIYFGEYPNDYVFTNTKLNAFDYPSGDKNIYSKYQGNAGIKVKGLFRKIAFAFSLKSAKILFSSDITKDSKLLLNRNIIDRARTIAPFLSYDKAYPVISNGRIMWIIDAYTTTKNYPYSEMYYGINYIRNSVKVTINAYDGATSFYVNDERDPIIKTYQKIFPGLFKSMDEMPKDLQAHLRYPKQMFAIQAGIYSTYHMLDPQVFYNKEDVWNMPNEVFEKDSVQMQPYYIIMKLLEEKKEEYILMLPFTPVNRDNMISWMAARCDGKNRGELIVYRFPKDSLIYGPMQIEARINQDSLISQQFTLWSQKGTRVIRGNLMVIPIENSLIYVEPVYLQADLGKIPELRGVIVAYGEKIVMERTLDEALFKVLSKTYTSSLSQGNDFGKIENISSGSPSAKKALEQLNRANRFLRDGNWAEYGKSLKQLEETLKKLAEENATRT
jgi:uncharacterized protein